MLAVVDRLAAREAGAGGGAVAAAEDHDREKATDTWSAASTADLTSTLEEQVDANKLTHYAYDTLAKGQVDSSTRYAGGVSGSAYTKQVTAYDSLYRATTTKLVLPTGDALVSSGAVPSSTLGRCGELIGSPGSCVAARRADNTAGEAVLSWRGTCSRTKHVLS
ncbi:hypothetical protein [Streptomyces sp. NBC_00847]|uniref:hypothetical protein n=1 Tax=Streptomyces sp. NBC_00847 TaxID=2975850 RepID=UPI00224E41F8|nr:hypothetical protein [Streptomyces sp. NBC_00847]MCX4882742.1 hypothetical protein [Streptomyces sp. NBC_00847]